VSICDGVTISELGARKSELLSNVRNLCLQANQWHAVERVAHSRMRLLVPCLARHLHLRRADFILYANSASCTQRPSQNSRPGPRNTIQRMALAAHALRCTTDGASPHRDSSCGGDTQTRTSVVGECKFIQSNHHNLEVYHDSGSADSFQEMDSQRYGSVQCRILD
jgi:hypothetical protein